MSAFLPQYYLDHDIPGELLLSHRPADLELLERVLGEKAGHRVRLTTSVRGNRARWLKLAQNNAEHALGAWLKYRDAWVRFAAIRYPDVSKFAWMTLLTEKRMERLEKLKRIYCE